ncbi:GmrSD restriction endonuclease domain-containing protein [Tundrisphaera sp. TA3]|uniref:GmrSD restriction endonuclease domain-containing protein n=1 Tax=Tundrisphaera sp. TA3 TaxID=3435775 RepID=UPI003EB787F5
MATTLFKEVKYSLSKLVEDIEMGEIGLPDIQRPFVWKNNKVRDLFDSMFRGYPVGYLLFWANGKSDGHRQIGTDAKRHVSRLLIVDGQQRLTSLFAVLKGIPVVRENFRKERIRIAFRPKDSLFEVADAATGRDPEYIADVSELWAGSVTLNRFVRDFLKRLREHREVPDEEEDRISEAIGRLFNLREYPFTAMELSSSMNEEQVSEVFVRINSKGKSLNQADFVLTLMSVFWDDGRTEIEEFCRLSRQPSTGNASPFNHFFTPDADHLLRVSVAVGFRRARLQYVYSLLRGKDLDTGEFSDGQRVKQFDILKQAQSGTLDLQNWHEFFKVLIRAGYRRGDMISSQINMLYCYALFLIGRKEFGVDLYRLRNVMARWFFMSSLTSRYTGSPESVMEQDLAGLRDVRSADEFVAHLDRITQDALPEDYWAITLPNELATSSARSPSLFAYYAALNLLDARVLFSKLKVSELLDPASHANKSAIERHHLFAKNYLRSLGITEPRDTNQIANYALVEWSDNIAISDGAPAKYYPQYAARYSAEELDRMRHWHALPDGWEVMSYLDFLHERRRRIAQVIREGYKVLLES